MEIKLGGVYGEKTLLESFVRLSGLNRKNGLINATDIEADKHHAYELRKVSRRGEKFYKVERKYDFREDGGSLRV